MAEEDDEFEMLCKSFEGTERPEDETFIESKDTSDILDEIDSFLEEDVKDCIEVNKCSTPNNCSDTNSSLLKSPQPSASDTNAVVSM